MNLSNFSLLKEYDDHYEMAHPKGQKFKVEKKGLSDKAHKLIQKLKKEPQHFDEGGEVANSSSMEDSPQQITADMEQMASGQTPMPAEMGAAAPSDAPQAPTLGNNEALQNEKQAIQAGAAAEGRVGQKDQAAVNDFIANSGPTPDELFQKHQAADQQLAADFASKKIDPDRYLHNMSTGSKIAAGIGMLLSGIGSGITGQPNVAMAQINRAIDNDIEAQKNDQSKAMNLWKMNREATNDEMQAHLATRNQMLNIVKAKMMAAQAGAQSAMAKARIAPIIGQIDQQMAVNNYKRGLLGDQSNGGILKSDPATLVPFLVPKEHQQKVFNEIDAAKNTAKAAKEIMQEFDNAANTVNATDFVPGMQNRHQKALHALMGPTFQDVEGTVRQAAMDNMAHNTTPQFGDNAETIKTKRNALEHYLRSKESAATASGYMPPLTRFESTRYPVAPQVQEVARQDPKTGKIAIFDANTKKFIRYQ